MHYQNPNKLTKAPFPASDKALDKGRDKASNTQPPNRLTVKQQTGAFAEQSAKRFLLLQGLQFIDQNVRFKVGEIDLIFLDEHSHTYVFVEVRFRKSSQFGGAAASVSIKKQQKIKKAAIFYLQKRKLTPNIRFDVIAYENGQLNWIESAFS